MPDGSEVKVRGELYSPLNMVASWTIQSLESCDDKVGDAYDSYESYDLEEYRNGRSFPYSCRRAKKNFDLHGGQNGLKSCPVKQDKKKVMRGDHKNRKKHNSNNKDNKLLEEGHVSINVSKSRKSVDVDKENMEEQIKKMKDGDFKIFSKDKWTEAESQKLKDGEFKEFKRKKRNKKEKENETEGERSVKLQMLTGEKSRGKSHSCNGNKKVNSKRTKDEGKKSLVTDLNQVNKSNAAKNDISYKEQSDKLRKLKLVEIDGKDDKMIGKMVDLPEKFKTSEAQFTKETDQDTLNDVDDNKLDEERSSIQAEEETVAKTTIDPLWENGAEKLDVSKEELSLRFDVTNSGHKSFDQPSCGFEKTFNYIQHVEPVETSWSVRSFDTLDSSFAKQPSLDIEPELKSASMIEMKYEKETVLLSWKDFENFVKKLYYTDTLECCSLIDNNCFKKFTSEHQQLDRKSLIAHILQEFSDEIQNRLCRKSLSGFQSLIPKNEDGVVVSEKEETAKDVEHVKDEKADSEDQYQHDIETVVVMHGGDDEDDAIKFDDAYNKSDEDGDRENDIDDYSPETSESDNLITESLKEPTKIDVKEDGFEDDVQGIDVVTEPAMNDDYGYGDDDEFRGVDGEIIDADEKDGNDCEKCLKEAKSEVLPDDDDNNDEDDDDKKNETAGYKNEVKDVMNLPVLMENVPKLMCFNPMLGCLKKSYFHNNLGKDKRPSVCLPRPCNYLPRRGAGRRDVGWWRVYSDIVRKYSDSGGSGRDGRQNAGGEKGNSGDKSNKNRKNQEDKNSRQQSNSNSNNDKNKNNNNQKQSTSSIDNDQSALEWTASLTGGRSLADARIPENDFKAYRKKKHKVHDSYDWLGHLINEIADKDGVSLVVFSKLPDSVEVCVELCLSQPGDISGDALICSVCTTVDSLLKHFAQCNSDFNGCNMCSKFFSLLCSHVSVCMSSASEDECDIEVCQTVIKLTTGSSLEAQMKMLWFQIRKKFSRIIGIVDLEEQMVEIPGRSLKKPLIRKPSSSGPLPSIPEKSVIPNTSLKNSQVLRRKMSERRRLGGEQLHELNSVSLGSAIGLETVDHGASGSTAETGSDGSVFSSLSRSEICAEVDAVPVSSDEGSNDGSVTSEFGKQFVSLPPTGPPCAGDTYFPSFQDRPIGIRGIGEVVYDDRNQMLVVVAVWEKFKTKFLSEAKLAKHYREEGVILSKYKNKLKINKLRYSSEFQWIKSTHLGNGMTGKCHLAMDFETDFKFCVKEIHISNYEKDEIELMSKLDHEHIVQVYGAIRHAEKIYILQEFIEGGCLTEAINTQKKLGRRLSQMTALRYFQQLLKVLVYLKKRNILHEDIKADNILLDRNLDDSSGPSSIKVTDFGMARPCQGSVQIGTKPVGTQTQWSPEKAEAVGYGFPAEVWAANCVLVHILSGLPPWVKRFEEMKALILVIVDKSPPLEDVPKNILEPIRDLIMRAFTVCPGKRPTAEELLSHQAFKLLDEKTSESSGIFSILETNPSKSVAMATNLIEGFHFTPPFQEITAFPVIQQGRDGVPAIASGTTASGNITHDATAAGATGYEQQAIDGRHHSNYDLNLLYCQINSEPETCNPTSNSVTPVSAQPVQNNDPLLSYINDYYSNRPNLPNLSIYQPNADTDLEDAGKLETGTDSALESVAYEDIASQDPRIPDLDQLLDDDQSESFDEDPEKAHAHVLSKYIWTESSTQLDKNVGTSMKSEGSLSVQVSDKGSVKTNEGTSATSSTTAADDDVLDANDATNANYTCPVVHIAVTADDSGTKKTVVDDDEVVESVSSIIDDDALFGSGPPEHFEDMGRKTHSDNDLWHHPKPSGDRDKPQSAPGYHNQNHESDMRNQAIQGQSHRNRLQNLSQELQDGYHQLGQGHQDRSQQLGQGHQDRSLQLGQGHQDRNQQLGQGHQDRSQELGQGHISSSFIRPDPFSVPNQYNSPQNIGQYPHSMVNTGAQRYRTSTPVYPSYLGSQSRPSGYQPRELLSTGGARMPGRNLNDNPLFNARFQNPHSDRKQPKTPIMNPVMNPKGRFSEGANLQLDIKKAHQDTISPILEAQTAPVVSPPKTPKKSPDLYRAVSHVPKVVKNSTSMNGLGSSPSQMSSSTSRSQFEQQDDVFREFGRTAEDELSQHSDHTHFMRGLLSNDDEEDYNDGNVFAELDDNSLENPAESIAHLLDTEELSVTITFRSVVNNKEMTVRFNSVYFGETWRNIIEKHMDGFSGHNMPREYGLTKFTLKLESGDHVDLDNCLGNRSLIVIMVEAYEHDPWWIEGGMLY